MRRLSLISLALLTVPVLVPAGAGPASAQTYPVESLLESFDGPLRDAQTGDVRTYNFEEGLYGAFRRMLTYYPELIASGSPDPAHELQHWIDGATHMRPAPPHNQAGDVGHADYTPDWDHDGVFGDGGGTAVDGYGDYDAYIDSVPDTAYFRVPCLDPRDPYLVHFRYRDGRCDVADEAARPYALGVAHQVTIVNAQGLRLAGVLWLPPGSFGRGCPAFGSARYGDRAAWRSCAAPANLRGRHPGLVMAPGIASRQEHYWWVGMRMAGAGYVALNYDVGGQGASEGGVTDLFGMTSESDPAGCRYAGACHDVEDAVRWMAGVKVLPLGDAGPRLEDRADPAAQPRNPALRILDRSRLGLAGHSMGGAAVLSYLRGLGRGAGTDGRPLPRLRAATSLSYAAEVPSVVPLQFQTSDYDGLPLGISLLQANAGGLGEGLGYSFHKDRYDALRALPQRHALSLIVLEGGTHTDFIDQPFILRTEWANHVAGHYLQAWMDCHVRGLRPACAAAARSIPHLSRTFASEFDTDGSGPAASRCITVPDQWSLALPPGEIPGAVSDGPPYDCVG